MKLTFLFLAGLVAVGCADPEGAGGTTTGSGTSASSSGSGMEEGAGANDAAGGGDTTSEGGDRGDGGSGGNPGQGGAPPTDTCSDQGLGELNDTMATATQLASGTDCDNLTSMGTIDGPDDVDWYKYVQTDDEWNCNVNPARDWAVQQGHTLRVCKYVECQVDGMSPDTVNCNDGSTPDTQGGLDGCCHTEPFNVGIGFWGCEGSTDLLNVYTRIDEPDATADACTHYNFNYTF